MFLMAVSSAVLATPLMEKGYLGTFQKLFQKLLY